MSTHNHVRKLLAGVHLIVTTVFHEKAAGNDNIADFAAVCGVVNLQQKKEAILKQPTLPSAETLLADLQKLNLSTATDSWFNDKDGEFRGGDKDPEGKKLKAWQDAAKAAVEGTQGQPNPFKRLPTSRERMRANAIIASLLTEAEAKVAAYNTKVAQITKTEQAAADKLDDAVFGPAKKAFDKEQYNINKHTSKGRTKICGAGTTGDDLAGEAAADALICMCTGNAGTPAGECYATKNKQVTNSGDQSTPAEEAWNDILTKCALLQQPQAVTAATIEAAAAAVISLIGALNTHATASHGRYTLGKSDDSSCDGTANDKYCISYKKQLSGTGGGIKWLASLNEAAAQFTKAQIAYTDALDLSRGLQQLSRQARDAYTTAAHDIANPLPITQPIQSQTTKLTKEEDCNRHKSSDKCATTCKWNENVTDPNKKCSLDTTKAAEQATQAAGTGEQKKEEKCKGKVEDVCKKEAGCKWESNACKDCSFLLKKKLALISSTFKSLVTF
uniref:Variant surface glycoprotein 1125.491 n=1 Tax=Trypanosoma brucei TaxID=5691 RepID=A0A1J0R638_9TRYP|nr:variant surface glycoprotein 1125.491 [Trypanosoma brucei]